MPPKKSRASATRVRKTPMVRKKYTEGNQPVCSAEKRGESIKTPAKTPLSSPDPSKPPSKKQVACQKWFNHANSMGLRGIRRLFIEQIKKYNPELPTMTFNDETNLAKNRYDDVLLIDKTKVKIRINPDNDDYIHASTVEVRPDLSYICAQGPLQPTITNFWLMAIQEESKVILQLCKGIEDEKEKCSDYLPNGVGESATYGPVQIKILSTGPISTMKKVTKTIVQCIFDGKETTLCHILYFGWPDHSVPESLPTFRELRTLVHKLCEKKPVILHCSAGIGRTGTFAAIDIVCHKLLNECDGDFSMIDLMHELRKQRMQAVQNDQQYSFIYRAVIEILITEKGLTKTPDVTQFIQSYENLVQRKTKKKRPVKTSNRTVERAPE